MSPNELTRLPEDAKRVLAKKNLSADVKPHHLIMTALGIAVGYQVPVPSSPVANPNDYWLSNHADIAKHMISDVNEELLVPYKQTYEMARRVWLTRYRLVHMPMFFNVWEFVEEIIEEDAENFSPVVREIVDCLDDSESESVNDARYLIYDLLEYFNAKNGNGE